jgi:hypothetical protein
MVLSAGSVERVDDGEPIAIWQEYDNDSNPYAEAARRTSLHLRVADSINGPRLYVTVRAKGRMFLLLDGEERPSIRTTCFQLS